MLRVSEPKAPSTFFCATSSKPRLTRSGPCATLALGALDKSKDLWGSSSMGEYPQMEGFICRNLLKIDDLGVPLF